MNISADRRFVVAALGDGTIRWYTFERGDEVLALFIDRDLRRWVAWNPDGFFSSQGGGDSLIGYHINRGRDQAGEFVGADREAAFGVHQPHEAQGMLARIRRRFVGPWRRPR